MEITIKHRFTNEVIIEGEAENLKEFLEKNCGADLRGANLGGANLDGADLGGANLRGAKIKITQKDEFLKALKIEIME